MTSRLLLVAALAAGLTTLTGCGQREDANLPATDGTTAADGTDAGAAADTAAGNAADAGRAMPMAGDPAAGTQAEAGMAGERAALGVLQAINAHEIAAGQQALGKSVGGEVAEYAQMMIDEHTENRDKTAAFNPDDNAADARAQKAKGEEELAALGRMEGDAYAKAYIDAMVKGHTEALAALDGTIIPAASQPEARAHLATTREHVARHLERAKELQAR